MTGAFALASALFQRERTGRGQRIDMAMLDVAMILMSSHLTGYLRNGVHPKPHGNRHPHATNGAFETKDGLVMLGASNLRQQRRLWSVLGRPDMIKRSNDERDADHDREIAVLSEIMLTRTADEWEEFLQARHVPAARVRTMGEALADPQTVAHALKEWGEVFQRLPRIDAIFVPGGDPGHTQPKHLMALLARQTENLHRYHPKAQMWVSPQGFTREWLEEFYGILRQEQPDLDGLELMTYNMDADCRRHAAEVFAEQTLAGLGSSDAHHEL